MRFIDIYILVERYKKQVIDYFLKKYLEGFEQAAGFYEYPQYSDNPNFSTESVLDMLDFLVNTRDGEYTLYWNNISEGEIINGMIFFCSDSSLIIGLSVIPEMEKVYINKLKADFNTNYCISSVEVMPPLNAKEFIKLVNHFEEQKS